MTPPAASATGRTALPRTVSPRAPRRVSGPSRGRAPVPARPLAARAARRGRRVADSRFLDRMLRGRVWVPVIAVALFGIVFLQVSMLKLNSGISRAVQASQTLERQNQSMRADLSRLEGNGRVQDAAAKAGLVVPSAGGALYLNARGDDGPRAAAEQMTAPSSEAVARDRAIADGTATIGGASTVAAATTTQQPAATEQPAAQQPADATTQQPAAQTQQAAAPQEPATPTPTQQPAATDPAATTGGAPQTASAAPEANAGGGLAAPDGAQG